MNRFTLPLALLVLTSACVLNRDFDSQAGTTGGTDSEGATSLATSSPTGGGSTAGASAGTDDSPPPPGPTDSTASTSATGTASETSSETGGDTSCVDLVLGTTIGTAVASGTTVGRANDYTTMECIVAEDSGGFIGPDKSEQADFVISWTFPETGAYVIKSSAEDGLDLDPVIAVAGPSCDAAVIDCDDQCAADETALVVTGRAGQSVHLIVEGFAQPGAFSISIFEGDDPMCADPRTTGGEVGTTSDDFGSSGGGFIAD